MKKLTIRKIIEEFNHKVLSGKSKLDNQITRYGLNRAGLELTGFYSKNSKFGGKRVILMSNKENEYISQFDKETKIKKYTDLINSGCPAIIITQKFTDKVLINLAKELDFLLVKINYHSTTQLIRKILDVYDKYFSPSLEMHASLLNIFGKGVLIKGKSGIGKSEVSLELIKHNHLFVGDDRIVLTNKSNKLFGKAHPILKNLIEVRGIGIFDISKANGYQIIMEESPIDLLIELVEFKDGAIDTSDRLGYDWAKIEILGVNIEYIQIPVRAGRNLSNIIESAVSQFKINKLNKKNNIADILQKRTEEFWKLKED